MQCQKIDEIKDGEAVLKGSRYVPHLCDNFANSFSKGALMWSGERFSNVAHQLTYTEYEAMSRALADTGNWQASKPARSGDQAGTAAFLHAPAATEQVCAWTAPRSMQLHFRFEWGYPTGGMAMTMIKLICEPI